MTFRVRPSLLSLLPALCLGACFESDVMKGFERLGGEGTAHFVYVHPEYLGHRVAQREAGQTICEQYHQENYCEVFFWAEREKVVKSLPFQRADGLVGVFTLNQGKTTLQPLEKE